MDPEHVPARAQSEIISPVLGSAEDRSGIIQTDSRFNPAHPNVPRMTTRIDTSNLNPSAGNIRSSIISERSEPIQPLLPTHFPESHSERRDTRIDNDNPFSSGIQAHNGIDWIVPTIEHTVEDRLKPTLENAVTEKNKYVVKAKWTAYALNGAIGLQVLLGALTTSLSALAISGKSSTATATTALGAIATLVASYLARARGSNEPELSITRIKDLEQFIRECDAFLLDHGHVTGHEYDQNIIGFRRKFEELLGNTNAELKPQGNPGGKSEFRQPLPPV